MEQTTLNNDALDMLEGTVEGITYQNAENGYTVCDLAVNGEELVTVVGVMPFLHEGEMIRVMGTWQTHPQYGKQFRTESFEKQLPESAASILKYLSSRAVKGIGPASAKKIVDRFAEDTFDVLENHPDLLAGIPGISRKKAEEISENFKRQFGIRSVMMFCRDFFGPATAVKVYNRWGGSAVDVIKENPYSLCDEIYGIGFERADRIARDLGIRQDSEYRIRAGIKYFLNYNAINNGHVFIPRPKLVAAAAQMLSVSEPQVEAGLTALENAGALVTVGTESYRCVYLKSYYEAESYTARKLDLLDKLCERISVENVDRYISTIELEDGIEYASMQKKAIHSAMAGGVMILTGGPGTGKTTVIRALLRIFDSLGMDTALAAPTGRAAKKMSQATQREAKTIHRLLEMEYSGEDEPAFRRDADNLLDEDALIIDEASMIDISLMASLMRAVKPGARLILIGDADQLPSVGAGNVLRDVIASERFHTVKLNHVFRQADESLIITNAHAINHGEYPTLDSKRSDFFFVRRPNDEDIARTVVDLCLYRLPKTYGEDIRNRIQVISPSRKGTAGTIPFNALLPRALNPPAPTKREKKSRDVTLREGDRVMQVRNNYDISWKKDDGSEGVGVFNGDIGIIAAIDPSEETVTVRFDDRTVKYEFSQTDDLEHAYAITVHKSQGSEYPVVIIPMYRFAPQLMTRNLLYTAVTRAQNMVILVGREDVVMTMVDNNRQALRYTGLRAMLRATEQ
mgnify:CR=1 FL=1